MKIIIETIPHQQQRYPTPGDWYYQNEVFLTPEGSVTQEVLNIKVSELGDWRYTALIAVHELIEVLACQYDGVTQDQVDLFDMNFEANRPPGDHSEPGDDPAAPYQKQHCLATAGERMLAVALGVKWGEYADAVEALP